MSWLVNWACQDNLPKIVPRQSCQIMLSKQKFMKGSCILSLKRSLEINGYITKPEKEHLLTLIWPIVRKSIRKGVSVNILHIFIKPCHLISANQWHSFECNTIPNCQIILNFTFMCFLITDDLRETCLFKIKSESHLTHDLHGIFPTGWINGQLPQTSLPHNHKQGVKYR